MIYQYMMSEKQRLEKEIESIQMQLKDFPKGDFFCSRNGKYYKWYHTDGKKQTYISKKERPYAEKLAVKKYLSLLLEDMIQKKASIDQYLKSSNFAFKKSQQLIDDIPEYKNFQNT